MARRGEAELSRRARIEQPAGQHAAVDDVARRGRDAFAVERLGAQAARPARIVGDGDAVGEHGLAHTVLEKTRAARDRRAADRRGEVADQAARDPRVVNHRHRARWRLARAEPGDRALAGAAADRGRIGEVGGETRARVIVVALHRGALAGDHAGADAELRDAVAAFEAVRGHQRDARAAPARLGALGIGHAGDGAGGVLGRRGLRDQRGGCRLDIVGEVEVGHIAGEQFAVGQAAKRILGHRAGHRHGALDQAGQRIGRDVGRRHHGLAAAAEDAQADVPGFGALDTFRHAEALGDAEVGAFEHHRVGGVGASSDGAAHEIAEPLERLDRRGSVLRHGPGTSVRNRWRQPMPPKAI